MNDNQFKLPDGRLFTIVNDGILVERMKLPEKSAGGIIMHNRHKEDATAIGVIRAVGTHDVKKPKDGPQRVPIDILKPGMNCAFLWFYAERHTNQLISARLGENLIVLKWQDISLVWEADEHFEISDITSNAA